MSQVYFSKGASQQKDISYNFIELISPDPQIIQDSVGVFFTIRTMRNPKEDDGKPQVIINGTHIGKEVMEYVDDERLVLEMTELIILEQGLNNVTITSNNGFMVQKSFTINVRQPPQFENHTIVYPNQQLALKAGESATLIQQISGFDTISYNSPYFSISNPEVYEEEKTITYTGSGQKLINLPTLTINAFNTEQNISASKSINIGINDNIPTAEVTIQKNKTGGYFITPFLAPGTHRVRVISNDSLLPPIQMSSTKGTVGSFTITGNQATADFFIQSFEEEGAGEFTNFQILNLAKKPGTTLQNNYFFFDKESPEILNVTVSNANWFPGDGPIDIVVLVNEPTTGFNGTANLTALGGALNAQFTPHDNNKLIHSFVPSSENFTGSVLVTIFDRAGNSSTSSSPNIITNKYRLPPEDLYFDLLSNISQPLAENKTFINNNNVTVNWGSTLGFTYDPLLVIDIDYEIIDDNKIKLTEKWINVYTSNFTGELHVTVWEE